MTCGECMETVIRTSRATLTATRVADDDDLTLTEREDLQSHLGSCGECSAAVALVLASDEALHVSLSEPPMRASIDVAEYAWKSAKHGWKRRLTWVVSVAIVIAALGFAAVKALPEIRRLTSAPPPVITKTFSLTCLSPEQAESLLQPYLPRPENPRWQAERFGVFGARNGIRAVTVSAPQDLIDRIPALLAQFEREPGAACRRDR